MGKEVEENEFDEIILVKVTYLFKEAFRSCVVVTSLRH